MKALGKIQSEYVSSELSCFVASTSGLSYLDNVVNGYFYNDTNPFPTGTASNSKLSSTNLNYSEGAYYSNNELSPAGESQVTTESTLNNFYPLMYQTSITGFFQGYEIDEILYFYPKTQRKTDYTPINAEWYYKTWNSSDFCITEPYAGEQAGSWISAFSRAFTENSEVIRVAALNGSFDHILPQFQKFRILDSGFSLLIGKQGVILNLPEAWDFRSSKTYTRIFDEDVTGISSSKWEEISNSLDGSSHQFTDASGVKFKVIKYSVVSSYLDLTHYILVCIQKDRLRDYAKETNESFSEVYVDLFWTILACGLFTFCIATFLIFTVSRTHSIQLKLIKGVFQNVVKKAILFRISSKRETKSLEEFSQGFETLFEACRLRLNKLEEVESGYVSHGWDYKEPGDVFLYDSWQKEKYPFNYYWGKSMNWKYSLIKLKFNLSE